MIKAENLSCYLGKKSILKNISFQVNQGEMLCVLGPNGAGKSTLLKILCGDITNFHGQVFIQDKNIKEYKNKELAVNRAVLTQNNQVSINFTVFELVLMGRYPHFDGRPKENDLDIVEQVLKEMGIFHLKSRTYYSLSGGEQQRVQLARVLAQIYQHSNGILFLDEPINGLDILYQDTILKKAREMANRNFTVVCILHDINFAARYADNILILKQGEVVDLGHPNRVINAEILSLTYDIQLNVLKDAMSGHKFVVPAY